MPEGKESLKAALARISKVHETVVSQIKEMDVKEVEVISSGSYSIDHALGRGGFPRGTIAEIFGKPSGGKTTLSLLAIAEAQKLGGNAAFIDVEHCLTGDSLVYLADYGNHGRIEDLVDKDIKVLSLSSKGKPIIQNAIVKYAGDKEVYEIKAKYGRVLKATGNHRVLTSEGYKLVSDLRLDDILVGFSNIPQVNNSDKLSRKEKNLYRLLGYHLGDGSMGQVDIANIDPIIIEDLQKIAKENDCHINHYKYNLSFHSNNSDRLNIPKKELEELFLQQHLYVKDIARIYNCSEPSVKQRLLEFKIVSDKDDLLVRSNKMKYTNYECLVASKNIEQWHPNSLHRFLSKFESFFLPSKQRYIPNNLKQEQLRQVLSGLFMTDGTVISIEYHNRCSLSFSTSSRRLAYDIQASLLKFGITSSVGFSRKEKYDLNYQVNVNGVENFIKFYQNIPTISYKHDRIKKAILKVTPLERRQILDNTMLFPIKSIIKLKGKQPVYDLSVNNPLDYEQNFFCEGLIVHNSLDLDWAAKLGVKTDDLIVTQPDSGEQALQIVEELVQTGQVGIIVVDSVAGLIPRSELEAELGQQNMAAQARLLSQALRRLVPVVGKSRSVLLFINQVRDGLNPYGPKEVTPGGNALKFYSSLRLSVKKVSGSEIKGSEGEPLGHQVEASIVKNKTAAPGKKATFTLRFLEGVDRVEEIVNLGITLGIVEQAGPTYKYDGVSYRGKEKIVEAFRADDKLQKALWKAVQEYKK